ncbi:MAG: hypothetical protein IJA55_09615 [Clostridia bacterium]|nr:hypothetical protein [Clostridia bacterium]
MKKKLFCVFILIVMVCSMTSCIFVAGGILDEENTYIGTWTLADWWSTNPLEPTEDKSPPAENAIVSAMTLNEDGSAVVDAYFKGSDHEYEVMEADGYWIITIDNIYGSFAYDPESDTILGEYGFDDDIILCYTRN